MTNTIICKYCGKELEISEALRQQIEEQVVKAEDQKHKLELEKVKQQAWQKAEEKIKTDMVLKIKEAEEKSKEESERSQNLQKQLLDLTKELRQIKRDSEDAKLELEKKLAREEAKIRQESRQKTEEEHRLKDLEKDKKLADVLKANEQLKRKLEQGSQQNQGEVLELELEEILKKKFPLDLIEEIKKGQRGADILQTVIDKKGRTCGKLLWEFKNAQWSETWIAKLREDTRQAKADLAILVVVDLPQEIKNFGYKDGIWITSLKLAVDLAFALRFDLWRVYNEKIVNSDNKEKAAVLYNYITSIEFKHRIEAIIESFTNLQNDIEKEKRWFGLKWARQEKEIRHLVDHTHGMYGELQSVTRRSLPQIKNLELDGA